jgi:ATP-dependent protease ClpP protease subunit
MKNLAIAALVLGVSIFGFKSIERNETLVSKFDIEIGEVDYYGAEDVIKTFKKAELAHKISKVITMGINSPGGSVHMGLEFIGEMKTLQSKGYKIKCYVRNAYSMGFVILQFCNERIGAPTSTYMHHLTSVNGKRPDKRTKKNAKLFKALDFFDNHMLEDISERLKMDPKKFMELIKEDNWWGAKKALKANIIDRIEPFSFWNRKIEYKINWRI